MEERKRGRGKRRRKGGGFNLSEIQSLSANIPTGIPGELFHIRVSLDYYRPLRDIPFSARRIKLAGINLISHSHPNVTEGIARIRKAIVNFNKQYE